MITYLKNWFRQPTPIERAAKELAMAQLGKLEAESAVDYAKSVVAYNDARIKRLDAYLKEQTK